MVRFILKRLGLALVTLAIATFVLFAVAQILPGDVGRSILGPYATTAQVARLDHQLGADKPIPTRYANWIYGLARGTWGKSDLLQVPVRPLVMSRLQNSLILGAVALGLIIPISIASGILAALRQGKPLDRIISVAGLSFVAVPEFVTGVALLVVFSIQLGWFPASSSPPSSANPLVVLHELLLPALPVMLSHFGYVSRMARAGTIDVLSANYIRTARLKGLPPRAVVWRHVMRNAMLPTVTVVMVQSGYVFGGLVVIETLFNYPGLGRLILTSATNHDIPTLQASVFLVILLFMALNLIADLLYGVFNPRIRLAGKQ
jgi:peptide/nickel transport system permease protein